MSGTRWLRRKKSPVHTFCPFGADRIVYLLSGLTDDSAGRDVYRHFDGESDGMVVELWGWFDQHISKPQSHVCDSWHVFRYAYSQQYRRGELGKP